MCKLAIVPLLFMAACATTTEPPKSLRLSDGSILFIDKSGYMTMVDAWGKPMSMRDGVTMQTEDGSVIVMKNSLLEKRKHYGSLNPKLH